MVVGESSTGPILDVSELTLSFGGVDVLQGVDLLVNTGDIVGVIGPNGAGKSAMLNCISGVYRSNGGAILLDGQPIQDMRPHRIASLGIARSFQHLELFPRLSLIENLLIARDHLMSAGAIASALWWGPARAEDARQREVAEAMIDFFELSPYRNKPVGSLAYGTQKLVGVARALSAEPRLLLLDEPGGGMTREEREDLARFLLRVRARMDIAMLWVEHDIQLVTDLSDRVIALDFGRVIADGEPNWVRHHPEVEVAYLGANLDADPSPQKGSSDA